MEHLELAEGTWGPDPTTFAWGYFGLLLGCLPGILCMTLSQLCPATTVKLVTSGDGRPSESDPGFLHLPNGTYTEFWGRLVEFWEGNRAASAQFTPPPHPPLHPLPQHHLPPLHCRHPHALPAGPLLLLAQGRGCPRP